MKTFRSTLPLILLAALSASLASCASAPYGKSGSQARSAPEPAYQEESRSADASGQRLTIQTGSGAKLNVPWFVEGLQNRVNEGRP